MNRKCWHGFGDDKNKPDGQTLSSSLLLLLLFPSNGLPYPRRLLVARSYYLREWIGAEFFRSTGHFYLFDYRFRPLGLFFFFFLEPILYDATWVTDPSLLLLLLYSTDLIQFFPPPNPPYIFLCLECGLAYRFLLFVLLHSRSLIEVLCTGHMERERECWPFEQRDWKKKREYWPSYWSFRPGQQQHRSFFSLLQPPYCDFVDPLRFVS